MGGFGFQRTSVRRTRVTGFETLNMFMVPQKDNDLNSPYNVNALLITIKAAIVLKHEIPLPLLCLSK